MQKKKLHTSEDTIKKMKREAKNWQKMFANHISETGLISTIYKKLSQLNNKKANSLIYYLNMG